MGSGGYTSKEQPAEGTPVPHIGGIEVGANPEVFLEGEALNTVEAPNNSKADGDNPAYKLPPFADGKDLRNRG